MSATLVPNSIEGLENYYQQKIFDDWEVPFGGISDSISDVTSFDDGIFPGSDTISKSTNNITHDDNIFGHDGAPTANDIHGFTPENSSAGNNDLSPKAAIAKQMKRRSRASRRKPTTLLNASIKNFRALVQQYTGCHSAIPAFRSGKGPITLSFGSSSSGQNEFPARSFGGAYYYYDTDPHQLADQFQETQQHYNQHHIYHQALPFSEYASDVSAPSQSGDRLY